MSELSATELPLVPPDGLVDWCVKTQLHDVHALVYRTGWYADPLTDEKEKCVDVRCSVCGKIAKMDKAYAGCSRGYASAPFGYYDRDGAPVIDGNAVLCPCCGSPSTAIYSGRVSEDKIIGSVRPLAVQAIQGRLVLTYWSVERHVDEAAKESIVVRPRSAFVVEKKKINCFSFHSIGWANTYRYKDTAGETPVVYPWKKEVLYGTTAENSKLDLYLKCKGKRYPVSYIRLWADHPRVENLMTQGAGALVRELIERDCKSPYTGWSGEVNIPKLRDVNWREKRPAQMLGLTKDVFRILTAQSWSVTEWELYKAIFSRGEKFDAKTDMLDIRKCGLDNVGVLLKSQIQYPVMRSVRYLLKQKKRDAITLTDYWNLVRQNGGNLNDASVRYPQNLKTAHDHETARQRFMAQEGYTELFAKRTEQLSSLSYEADGFLIRPVRSAEELYQEGKKLSHCVYSYLKRHVYGETAIMLIRCVDQPNVPFYTLELNEGNMTVRQNRGLRNCARTIEVQAFEEKWLVFAKKQNAKEGITV